MQSQDRAGQGRRAWRFCGSQNGMEMLTTAVDWTWSPMEDSNCTDNTRERSLSKIPRTTFAGRIDLVVFRLTAPSWPAMW
jgi:hypothetical protein